MTKKVEFTEVLRYELPADNGTDIYIFSIAQEHGLAQLERVSKYKNIGTNFTRWKGCVQLLRFSCEEAINNDREIILSDCESVYYDKTGSAVHHGENQEPNVAHFHMIPAMTTEMLKHIEQVAVA